MARGVKVYESLLKDYPINEDETVREYAIRVWQIKEDYGCNATNLKVFTDSLRCHVPHDRVVKIKRSETLQNGVVTSEKFGFVKEDEIADKSQFDATKLTTNPYGGQWVKYEKKDVDYLAEIKAIFSELKFEQIKPFKLTKSNKAIKITLADMHVGMSANNSLFEYKYDKDDFFNSLDLVYHSVINEYKANGKFDVLYIQDLGDGLDGYNKNTTRGGHELEQNMSNAEAFRTYVHGKINLINKLYKANIANKIITTNTVNCNHAGDFGYMANYAIKLAVEAIYKDVEFLIFEKFIEHFIYGEHCFIQSHGKDKSYMKSGMPLKLDDKTQRFISQYIDKFQIKSKYIHFEKGDLHQVGFNKCKLFDYRNFMSFAPPSNWIQHNFGDGYSGYSIQIINAEKSDIKHIDYFIDYTY